MMKQLYNATICRLLLASLVILLGIALPTPVSAVESNWWSAGHIIDDQVFYNKGSMSVGQIQQFLNSKVPTCDSAGNWYYSGGKTVYQYFHPTGTKFPLTCLKDYYENPTTHENNLTQTDGQAASIPQGAISAAQIIWDSAQQSNINPQVLIVLLQKENILITDTSPLPSQYRNATGYYCPDSNVCNTQYYGFYNQVTKAAQQFRGYANTPNYYNYTVGDNTILYNPNRSCGSSTVKILNQATASLYNYTPYQPNQATLNNLYGSGDSCSSYGNRNFWRTFYDWFGSPLVSYVWQNQGYAFLDKTESTYVDPNNLKPGETYIAKLHALNTGSAIWTNDGPTPVTLATSNPTTRGNSGLCNPTWVACDRPVKLQESSVLPGQLGHFKFTFQAPFTPGSYTEFFKPVAEFLAWANDSDVGMKFQVKSPGTYTWTNQGYAFLDKTESYYVDPSSLQPGEKYIAKLHALNTGTATWTNDGPTPFILATSNPTTRSSSLCTSDWGNCTRPVRLQESSVTPGQLGHFKFTFQAPNTPGHYSEYFKPVAEMLSWTNDSDKPLDIWVTPYTWTNQGYLFLDKTESAYVDPNNLHPGETYIAKLHALNTGSTTWVNTGPNPFILGTSNPTTRSSSMCTSDWITCWRPVKLQESSVAPGQLGHFKFFFKAPTTPGDYREYFKPVAEMLAWGIDTNVPMHVVVK